LINRGKTGPMSYTPYQQIKKWTHRSDVDLALKWMLREGVIKEYSSRKSSLQLLYLNTKLADTGTIGSEIIDAVRKYSFYRIKHMQ